MGGRKTRKTTSGSRLNWGSPGTKPIASPARTSAIGYGTARRSAIGTRATAIATRTISVWMSFKPDLRQTWGESTNAKIQRRLLGYASGAAFLSPRDFMAELTPPLSAEDHVD